MIRTLMVLFLISIFDMSCNVSANQSSKQPNDANAGITNTSDNNFITITNSGKELNRKIWTFSTSDIFFRKGLTPFDVTQQQYVNTVRKIHPFAIAFTEGKTSDWARQVIGDTMIFGGKGNGYNIPDWVPSNILQGMASHKFYYAGKSYDFFNAYTRLLHEIPAKGYILGNIMTGTCAEVIWMISRTHPEYVQLGLEQMRAEAYAQYWKKDASNYKTKFNQWADSIKAVYPDVKIVADVPPSHSNLQADALWIKTMQTGLKAEGIRDYWHLHWMSQGQFTGNINKDAAVMDQIFSKAIPNLIEKNKKLFPGKELIVDQWSVSLTGDGGRNPYKRTFFGTSYIPRMVHFMIEYNRDHDNTISSAKYENLKQLIGNKGSSSMEYEVTCLAAGLFTEPADVLTIACEINGVEVTGVKANGVYKLLFLNASGQPVTLPTQISCDGKLLSIKIINAISSPSLTSTSWENFNTDTELKPFSVAYAVLSQK